MRFNAIVSKYFLPILIFINFAECTRFKIVGGELADILETPFQIVYYSEGDFVCSGSLISPRYVLTAAHCIYYFRWDISVRLGSSFRDRGGITIRITKYFYHPKYSRRTFDYDFAIMRLAAVVKFTRFIQPAILPRENEILPIGTECTVSGWGQRSFFDTDEPPIQLLAAKIQVSDFKACNTSYARRSKPLTDRMFCAGLPDGSKDSCLGDSGGPLVCGGVLYGIVSFGYSCALKDFPGVYSRISTVIPWIQSVLALN